MALVLNQYPKNKIIAEKLSADQLSLRVKAKHRDFYLEQKRCKMCQFEQPITEYYIHNKETGRRNARCRDCILKQMGVVEIGKIRFSEKIFDKGFRRCSICKDIKPLEMYDRNGKYKGNISPTCKECNYTLSRKFITAKRDERRSKRKPKHILDGHEFFTSMDFANHILTVYGNAIDGTLARLASGKTEKECTISEYDMRSSAYTKGSIKVVDTVTGKERTFKNTLDKELKKMFSTSAITLAVKTGRPTTVTKLSKYPNPCTIHRMPH